MEVMEDILLPPLGSSMQASGEFDAIPEPQPDRKVIVGVCVMDKKVGQGGLPLLEAGNGPCLALSSRKRALSIAREGHGLQG